MAKAVKVNPYPTIAVRRLAGELGVKVSMSDDEITEVLKGAKVIKSQREKFVFWLRKTRGYK